MKLFDDINAKIENEFDWHYVEREGDRTVRYDWMTQGQEVSLFVNDGVIEDDIPVCIEGQIPMEIHALLIKNFKGFENYAEVY